MGFLKGLYWDFPMSVWSEGFIGKFFSLLFMSLLVGGTAFLMALAFNFADTRGLRYKEGVGVVIAKRFDPAHSVHYTTTVMVGKVPVPTPHVDHYPDRYFLSINVQNKLKEIQVANHIFKNTKEKDSINIEYAENRFTNRITLRLSEN